MAAPNIAGLSTITGSTAVANATTVTANLVTNSTGSNKVYKINSLYVSNIDGSNTADITTGINRGSVLYKLAHTVTVPADATLVVITKDSQVYLEEGDVIQVTASANSVLQAVCSFEIIE